MLISIKLPVYFIIILINTIIMVINVYLNPMAGLFENQEHEITHIFGYIDKNDVFAPFRV